MILPYTLDESGNPLELGLIAEPSNIREDLIYHTVITETPEDDDNDILSTAKRGLKEESGYEVDDIEKWDYLGNISTSKIVINGNPAFGVDITGMIKGEKEGDGSESEKNSKFELIPVAKAINYDDASIACLFLKIFQSKLI
jgi:hypothetical protein